MLSSFTRNATVLGLLSAVGPFATDMSLPTLPAIAADLHASTILAYGLPSAAARSSSLTPNGPSARGSLRPLTAGGQPEEVTRYLQ